MFAFVAFQSQKLCMCDLFAAVAYNFTGHRCVAFRCYFRRLMGLGTNVCCCNFAVSCCMLHVHMHLPASCILPLLTLYINSHCGTPWRLHHDPKWDVSISRTTAFSLTRQWSIDLLIICWSRFFQQVRTLSLRSSWLKISGPIFEKY